MWGWQIQLDKMSKRLVALTPSWFLQNWINMMKLFLRSFLIPLALVGSVLAWSMLISQELPERVNLEWMSDHWQRLQKGKQVEEIWTDRKGGIMLG